MRAKDKIKNSPPPSRILGIISNRDQCELIAAKTKFGENKANGIKFSHDWIAFINKKDHYTEQLVYALVHVKYIVKHCDIRTFFFNDVALNEQINTAFDTHTKINLFGKIISIKEPIKLPPECHNNRQAVFNLPESTLSELRDVVASTEEADIFRPTYPKDLGVFCELEDAKEKKWMEADIEQKAVGMTIMLDSGVSLFEKYSNHPLLVTVTRPKPNPACIGDVEINCIYRNGPHDGCQFKKRTDCHRATATRHNHKIKLKTCSICKVDFFMTCMGCFFLSRRQSRLAFKCVVDVVTDHIKLACEKTRHKMRVSTRVNTPPTRKRQR
jgi:hypothetical protein